MPSRECYRLKRFLIRVFVRRHVALLVISFFIIWFTMFSLFWDGPPLSPTSKGEPYSSSRGLDAQVFVKGLAEQQSKLADGRFAGPMTGYDTKKLLAVLLDSLISRITYVERDVTNRSNVSCDDSSGAGCGSGAGSGDIGTATPRKARLSRQKLDHADLILGVQDRCALDPTELADFPQCEDKLLWMEKFWKSHSCYRDLGVDGSLCSFLIYLSEVESFCPKLPSRMLAAPRATTAPLQPRSDLAPLFNTVLTEYDNSRRKLGFIRERITRLWPTWVSAAASQHRRLLTRPGAQPPIRLHILLHLGLVSRAVNWQIAESSNKGGPLGELVQWADLVAALYAMGHDLRVTTEVEQLHKMAGTNPLLKSPCLVPDHSDLPDLIFTDIVGLGQFRAKFKDGYTRIKCLMRVLDTFGTQPKFNIAQYARKHRAHSLWGGWAMQPAQFFNLYPLTPDNSFLGFVVERSRRTAASTKRTNKHWDRRSRPLALVYGKKAYMWKGMKNYLNVLNDYFDIHATVPDATPSLLPRYVTNHKFLKPKKYQQLLSKARVFIGLGFPFEGPAPLEAIAQGAVFLNPRFDPPLTRTRSSFFKDKPTDREITSQHPYIERFIGEPHSYLVDVKDFNNVRAVVLKILSSPLPPVGMVPFELTVGGFVQRMAYYLRTHDFCGMEQASHYGVAQRWSSWWRRRRRNSRSFSAQPGPPSHSVQFFLGVAGDSCERTCQRRKRVCEPSYFPVLNSVSSLHELGGLNCRHVTYVEDHLAPFWARHRLRCAFLSNHLLFSCAGGRPGVQRVCPCRDFKPGQIALCLDCV